MSETHDSSRLLLMFIPGPIDIIVIVYSKYSQLFRFKFNTIAIGDWSSQIGDRLRFVCKM